MAFKICFQCEFAPVHLGMEAVQDKHLFYIAEWALTAPLPDGWVEQTEPVPGEAGKAVVYHNTASGVRQGGH
jgi:hypothetical protein